MDVIPYKQKAMGASAPELTYAWLHRRVQAFVSSNSRPPASRLERGSFWVGMGMAGIGLLVANLAQPTLVVLWTIRTCLVLEVVGLTISIALTVRRHLPEFRRPRESHADEMDADYIKWQRLVQEVRGFPREQREARLRYVSELRQRMTERMGLMYGGLQRLGVFPVLIALYLQFRDWRWGDWAGAFDVNLFAGLLIWSMLLLYGMGWLLVSMRGRLDSYVSLLEESLRD